MSVESLVTLPNGCKIRGLPPADGVVKYLGIPFAKPPIGPLRFESPQACDPWNNVLSATTLPNSCPQVRFGDLKYYNTKSSEDCLYLNVYVPEGSKVNLPVMVWIYGGGFIQGTISTYDFSLFTREDVVVVAMNYRLGPFGFLFREDGVSAVGIEDQQLALKWVQENIAAFGGNPDLVTIFGESAGGGSVAHHILSPTSQGLFKRAIIQSGASGCPWAVFDIEKGKAMALKFAKTCDALKHNGEVDMGRLKEIPADKIVEVLESNFDIEWAPIPDGYVINHDAKTLKNIPKAASEIDIFMGYCSNEGLLFVSFFWEDFLTLSNNFTNFEFLKDDQLVRTGAKTLLTLFHPGEVNESILDAVMDQFFGTRSSVEERLTALDELLSDLFFLIDGMQFADKISKNANSLYFYELDHKPSLVPRGPSGTFWDTKIFGCYHGADLVLQFPYEKGPLPDDAHVQECIALPYKVEDLTTKEQALVRRFVKYWTDFAKTGCPGPSFKRFEPQQRNYTRITTDDLLTGRDYMRRDEFWKKLR